MVALQLCVAQAKSYGRWCVGVEGQPMRHFATMVRGTILCAAYWGSATLLWVMALAAAV